MIEILTQHLGTIVVSLVIILLVVLAVWRIIADRRTGKHSCGGDCGNCPMGGQCNKRG
ncbi:MAG: FeoB-associated Cys-rich membrane protein [Lachnospiraceae bacterium]|nr:FeoB-associated Cys-rich membrane protein [Lachnospiraceae bacterium]